MATDQPGSAASLRLISAQTNHIPERDKFHYWNEVICRTVVDLDCRQIAQPHFEASFSGFDAPGLGVYDIHTRAHLVYRDKAEISRVDNDALIINYVTAGALHCEQDGRTVDLQPGDGAISDASRPYFLRFDEPLGCVSVKVYKSQLQHRVAGIERITVQSLARGSSLNPLVFGYMRSLLEHAPALTGPTALHAAEGFKELISASLNEMLQCTAGPLCECRAAALLRIKTFVDEHLREPTLDPAAVVSSVGLSSRFINKLFEAEQNSLGRYIWQRRLERCAAQLRDLAWAHVSVSAIALEHGFNDLSHFSRVFRKRYGAAAARLSGGWLRLVVMPQGVRAHRALASRPKLPGRFDPRLKQAASFAAWQRGSTVYAIPLRATLPTVTGLENAHERSHHHPFPQRRRRRRRPR